MLNLRDMEKSWRTVEVGVSLRTLKFEIAVSALSEKASIIWQYDEVGPMIVQACNR
jgi:hypothetical protein